MQYLIKTIPILLITSFLFSQEVIRIGVEYISTIDVKDRAIQTVFESSLEPALFQTVRETENKGWSQTFEIVSNKRMDDIFNEQKIADMNRDITSQKSAIMLGKLMQVKYIIFQQIDEASKGYHVSISLVNIETGSLDGSIYEFHSLYEQDKKYTNVKAERVKIRVNLMVKKLFNTAFDEPLKLAGAVQCIGITKKGVQCKREEPNFVMYDGAYCYQHRYQQ